MSEGDKKTLVRVAYLLTSAAYCSAVASHASEKMAECGDNQTRHALYAMLESRACEVSKYILEVAYQHLMLLSPETLRTFVAHVQSSRGVTAPPSN